MIPDINETRVGWNTKVDMTYNSKKNWKEDYSDLVQSVKEMSS